MLALHYDKKFVDEIKSGEHAGVLLDTTCFYAEQGGQIFDEGFITKTGDEVRAETKEPIKITRPSRTWGLGRWLVIS